MTRPFRLEALSFPAGEDVAMKDITKEFDKVMENGNTAPVSDSYSFTNQI